MFFQQLSELEFIYSIVQIRETQNELLIIVNKIFIGLQLWI